MLAFQPQRGFLIALLLLVQVPSQAEVQFDGTSGDASGLLTGDLTITEGQGLLTADQQALLHSFSSFSVRAGESVEFSHATPTVQNIIARVTGTSVSEIDGRLVSDANLWLLNPNGVLVGEDAQIDVAGSFRANDEAGGGAALILNDGSLVTVDTNLNTLSVAAPADFGFVFDVPADVDELVTADASSGTVVTPFLSGNGRLFDITGGTQVGGNLFHSFERFSVFADDAAIFISNSAVALDNVISRVTGGFKSFITGYVATDGSGMVGTSFWFVNSAGLFAGNGQSIDVGKSLNLGSADFISDGTGAQFRVDDSGASTFFAGSPTGFGFDVDSSAQALRISDLTYDQTGRLSNTVDDGISLAGADVELLRSELSLVGDPGQAGRLVINATDQITLADSALFTTAQGPVNAGSIELSGARLIANGSQLQMVTTVGDASAAPNRIFLLFPDSLAVDNSSITAVTDGAGSSGRVILSSRIVDVNDSFLATASNGSGTADVVVLQSTGDAGQVSITGDTEIANTTTQGTDGAEALGILVGSLTADVSIVGTEQTPVVLTGNAGVNAGANASIEITGENVSFINADVASDNAGLTLAAEGSSPIEISANDTLLIESSKITSATTGVNEAGSFQIAAREIVLVDSTISTATSGQGNAGQIRLVANDLISLLEVNELSSETTSVGDGANLVLLSEGDILIDNAFLSSSSTAPVDGGDAGSILLQAFNDIRFARSDIRAAGVSGAANFAILFANNIEVQSSIISSDAMGDVSLGGIVAFLALDQLAIDDSMITTTTAGAADASDIVMEGLNIQISDSVISGSTSGSGNASPINVGGPFTGPNFFGIADDRTFEADIVFANTRVSSETTGDGSFGNINVFGRTIRAEASEFRIETASMNQGDQEFVGIGLVGIDQVELQDSTLTSRTTGASDAGRITLQSQNTIVNASRVNSSSMGSGGAGQIVLAERDVLGSTSVIVTDSVLTSDTLDGNGGQVTLQADSVTLTGIDTRVSTNSAGAGRAGNVVIDAIGLSVLDGASVESRATGSGDSNTIRIQTREGGNFNLSSDVPGERSEILTDSEQSQGGDVQVETTGATFLINSAIVASAGASGAGGNVDLDANGLLFSRSVVLAQAQAGNGGQIDIDLAPEAVFIIDGESVINADSEAGSSGSVAVEAVDSGITSGLTPQSADLAPEVSLQRDSCAPPVDGQRASTFFVRAQGGRVNSPDAYLGKLGSMPEHAVPQPAVVGDCP